MYLRETVNGGKAFYGLEGKHLTIKGKLICLEFFRLRKRNANNVRSETCNNNMHA